MSNIGYVRVSTREDRQVLDRQLDALNAIGCERIFEDRGSGASTERSGLKACLDHLRREDVLLVLDLDRLGRLAGELIRLIDELESKGIGFRALNTAFDTTTPTGHAFLQIQAAFAQGLRMKIAEVFDGMESGIIQEVSLRLGGLHVGKELGGRILGAGRSSVRRQG
jgi:DNA invertase Pin-like site-specific DNA recombinase